MIDKTPATFASTASVILERAWQTALRKDLQTDLPTELSQEVDKVFECLEIGYKKALIIQTCGRAADPQLDAQALQKGAGTRGSWDAREFAKRVFVPWNSAAGSPLGTAPDPYVSNQFRQLRFDASIREKRKSKSDFDTTLRILELVNSLTTPESLEEALVEILLGLRRFLNGRSFEYALPNRSSLEDCQKCLESFLDSASGGARLQAVVTALFSGLKEFGIAYSDIKAGHANASDASSGSAGDVEFSIAASKVAVEVKDRTLTFAEVETSVEKARIVSVTELIFVVNRPSDRLYHSPDDAESCRQLAARQFSGGLNIYFEAFAHLARTCLMLVGEPGRRRFLELVGLKLEEQRADAQHRWAWAKAVKEI